jgi:hypothetical protein
MHLFLQILPTGIADHDSGIEKQLGFLRLIRYPQIPFEAPFYEKYICK